MCFAVPVRASCLLAQVEQFLKANGWNAVKLNSGEAATSQLGSQYEYGAKLDPSTGSAEDIQYLHLFVTATPVQTEA